jgi:diguanylate cyclase (GGDEF)-like protein/PAS domain S-box-containing protein
MGNVHEQMVSVMAHSISDAVIVLSVGRDGGLRYVLANGTARKKTGISESWYGRELEQIEPCPFTPGFLECCRQAVVSGLPIQYVKPEFTAAGATGETVVTPFRDETGTCVALLAVHKDVLAKDGLQQLLPSFMKSTPDAVLAADPDTSVIYCNEAFERMFGWSQHEIENIMLMELPILLNDHKHENATFMEQLRSGQTIRNAEGVRRHKDGTLVEVEISLAPIWDAEGRMIAFTAIYRDITERKRAEYALRKSESNNRLITENMTDLISIIDLTGKTLFASPSYESILGFSPNEMEGMSSSDYIYLDDVQRVQGKLTEMSVKKESRPIEFRHQKKDGSWVWVEVKSTPLIEEGKLQRLLLVTRDISERKQLEERAAHMTYHDPMTGIPNLRLLKDRLHQALLTAKRYKHTLGLLYFNLDEFKAVNQTYGLSEGDALLKEVVERLAESAGEMATVGRLAGDEFAVILPDLGQRGEVVEAAKEMLGSINRTFVINGNEIAVTASVGIACYPEDCECDLGLTLIDYAHLAMYRAKEQGKNHYRLFADLAK